MARITVEDCLTKETNRFALVLLAAKRTKQILTGAAALVDEVKNKAVVTSLREIAAGKVRFMTTQEQIEAREAQAQAAEAARRAREAALATQVAAGSATAAATEEAVKEADAETKEDTNHVESAPG